MLFIQHLNGFFEKNEASAFLRIGHNTTEYWIQVTSRNDYTESSDNE